MVCGIFLFWFTIPFKIEYSFKFLFFTFAIISSQNDINKHLCEDHFVKNYRVFYKRMEASCNDNYDEQS